MTSPTSITRSRRYTPLRYPGGKAKLAPFVKQVLACNGLEDGMYVEPFAGGAGLAIELLLQGYVSEISLNDISAPIFAFWSSVLNESDRFADRILNVPLTLAEWDKQKAVFSRGDPSNLFELGFSAFYLNRTNRSGVLNAGVIGGRAQSGKWLIDARFNRADLASRVARIGRFADQIHVSCLDAVTFLKKGNSCWPINTLIYADPPYFVKGRQLYYDFYNGNDHAALGALFSRTLCHRRWMVSYDDVPEVRSIYEEQARRAYNIPYSVRTVGLGSEIMFYSPALLIPVDEHSGQEIGPANRFDTPVQLMPSRQHG